MARSCRRRRPRVPSRRRTRGRSGHRHRRRSGAVRPAPAAGRRDELESLTTSAQWYFVSASQPPGATTAPTAPSRISTTGSTGGRRRTPISTTIAAISRSSPSPTMMPVTGTREMSTKPVIDGAEDRADGADAGEPADHGPGLGQRGEHQLDHHRRHRRQQRTGDDDRQAGHQEEQPGSVLPGSADQERGDSPRPRRRAPATVRSPAGVPPSRPRARRTAPRARSRPARCR